MSNSNEKTLRNGNIYRQKLGGIPVTELAQKYNLSLPRIHRICLKEENKALKNRVRELEQELSKK